MIRHVIFDWCGTLVNDLEAVWKATNQTFEKAEVAPLTLDEFRREFSLPFRPFYERYTPHCDEADLEHWFHDAFAKEQASVEPFPHSQTFLEFCRDRGLTTLILSSIHDRHFKVHLEKTGFGPLLDFPYVGVHDKRERISTILNTHNLDPAETLFIGDMQHDIDTAKHGGTRSCGVLTGFNSLAQLRKSEPDLIVEHLGELQRILEDNNGKLPSRAESAQAVQEQFPISTVGALIFDDEDRVLMIQTHKWSNKWGIPGGKIQWGEASEAALRREILEETNLMVEDIEFVLVQDAIFPHEFYRSAHFLLLNYTCKAIPPLDTRLNHEAQQFQWIPFAQVEDLDLNEPTITLLKAVQQARRTRKNNP